MNFSLEKTGLKCWEDDCNNNRLPCEGLCLKHYQEWKIELEEYFSNKTTPELPKRPYHRREYA